MNYLVAALFGYLLGSIPFGLLITRAAGLGDVRKIGSGNIGATNVLRTGNKGLAVLTLLLDRMKGTAAVLVAGRYGTELAIVAGLFAFGGWHVVTYTAEETVAPERTIPRALGLGIAIVTAAYIALNAVYFYILPVDKVLASTRVAADAAAVVLGNPGALGISALVMFSVFGAMMGSILAAPRVYFAMARDGLLFPWVNHLHPRFATPHR